VRGGRRDGRRPWRPWRRPPSARRTGRRGERIAARALRRRGYRILARNVRTPRGEIDLLALDGETLVVVEVKTTRAEEGPPPEHRLGAAQRRRLVAAGRWLVRRPGLLGRRVRHDLVAVVLADGEVRVRVHRARFSRPSS